MGPLIFVVDSQPESRELIGSCLKLASFTIRSFSALEPDADETWAPSLFLFGLHIGSDSALASKTLETITAGGIHCMIVTDSTPQVGQLSTLSFAADDWISKPSTPSELVSGLRLYCVAPAKLVDCRREFVGTEAAGGGQSISSGERWPSRR